MARERRAKRNELELRVKEPELLLSTVSQEIAKLKNIMAVNKSLREFTII